MCETEIERTEEDAYETDTISLSLGRQCNQNSRITGNERYYQQKVCHIFICLDQGPWGILLFHLLHQTFCFSLMKFATQNWLKLCKMMSFHTCTFFLRNIKEDIQLTVQAAFSRVKVYGNDLLWSHLNVFFLLRKGGFDHFWII